jgi:hypothetical protein
VAYATTSIRHGASLVERMANLRVPSNAISARQHFGFVHFEEFGCVGLGKLTAFGNVVDAVRQDLLGGEFLG